ncbi:apolipoprotein N-acyltransferase [Halobacteriovorax sp. HLS]|uniref:apolipoprotein N-acyltransferase n=1 Tax=Halobacteriovorax sp. HLS TaxID=2234000 RepID=UPI000FD8C59B|nr:apolipoprotein N-acyltransferase [Halobacteriovorax sp. HLS]
MNSPFQNKWTTTLALPFIGGLLYASSFPMTFAPSFFFGTIIGMAFLIYSLSFSNKEMQERSIWMDLLSVIAFSVGYNILGYYWIPETLNEFGQIPFPLNWTLGLVFSFFICPHLILFTIFHRYYKKISIKSSSFISVTTNRNIVYAIILTLFEYFTPQQFPAHIGHNWLQLAPNLALAPVFGAPLFSFINFWIALSLVSKLKFKKSDKMAHFVFCIILLINIISPLERTQNKASSTHQIRLVQPNIGNFLKISSENGMAHAFDEVFDKYFQLSTKPADQKIDLIFWPETAYPRLLNSAQMSTNDRYVPELIKSIITSTGAELFTGGYDQSSRKNDNYFQTEYNAAFHFGNDGKFKNKFRKIKLIPFGEGLPFGPLNKYLAKYIQNISFFASGESMTLFETNKGTPFVSAICYEILFSNFIREHLNNLKGDPEFLVNLTNDSWYGKTAEPFQHLYLSKWRALEFQLPIIRMTNTGITSVIYANGDETKRSEQFVEEVQDLQLLSSKRYKTPFQKYGIWLTIAFAIALLILVAVMNKFRPLKN